MISYRELSLDEVPRRMLEIDVSEHGEVVYYWTDGEPKAVPEVWDRPRWTQASWRQETWWPILDLPGVQAWGAFDGARLVGLSVYRPHLTDQLAQLAALFVSTGHRRQGIASRLTGEAERQAEADGHAGIYVSATPSESAVGFYRTRGYMPTQDANPELHALEPEDIHMIKRWPMRCSIRGA